MLRGIIDDIRQNPPSKTFIKGRIKVSDEEIDHRRNNEIMK